MRLTKSASSHHLGRTTLERIKARQFPPCLRVCHHCDLVLKLKADFSHCVFALSVYFMVAPSRNISTHFCRCHLPVTP